MLDEADDDAVRIMTIHGSKGLEFPITIISGLTTKLGRGRSSRGEVQWGEAGQLPEVKVSKTVSTENFDLLKELDDQMDKPERDRLLYVALTRARDHLLVSGYHGLDTNGEAIPSHGSAIHSWAAGIGAELVGDRDGQGTLFGEPSKETAEALTAPPNVPAPSEWRRVHQERVATASTRSVLSATAIAQEHYERASSGAYDEPPWHDDDADVALQSDLEETIPQEFRRGRAGTAIGSAVHGVLQLIDLAAPDDADVDALCQSQAWMESVPEHLDTITASVRSALLADIVVSCRTARHWKELFVAAPVGDVTVEGYVDLLVETADGLVVVDYKTDAVRNEADVDAKLDRYSLQGAAYAVAVEVATGMPVVDVQFVFAQASGPIVRSIDDLALRRTQVEAAAQPLG